MISIYNAAHSIQYVVKCDSSHCVMGVVILKSIFKLRTDNMKQNPVAKPRRVTSNVTQRSYNVNEFNISVTEAVCLTSARNI